MCIYASIYVCLYMYTCMYVWILGGPLLYGLSLVSKAHRSGLGTRMHAFWALGLAGGPLSTDKSPLYTEWCIPPKTLIWPQRGVYAQNTIKTSKSNIYTTQPGGVYGNYIEKNNVFEIRVPAGLRASRRKPAHGWCIRTKHYKNLEKIQKGGPAAPPNAPNRAHFSYTPPKEFP